MQRAVASCVLSTTAEWRNENPAWCKVLSVGRYIIVDTTTCPCYKPPHAEQLSSHGSPERRMNNQLFNELESILNEYVLLGSGEVNVSGKLVARAFVVLANLRKEMEHA